MNAPVPSGSDGSIPPIFSDDELRRLRELQATEPTPQQWATAERWIRFQIQQPTTQPTQINTSWNRRFWIALACGLLVSSIIGMLFAPWPTTEQNHQQVIQLDARPGIELAPEPRTSHDDEYPIAQAGDIHFIKIQAVPGATDPILPPPNCSNCPIVYAPHQP